MNTSTDRAIKVLGRMIDPKYVKFDKKIPTTLIRHCEGIAFVTIIKAGLFFLGGNIGGGCVVAKIPDPNDPKGYRWSGPSAVVCGGLGGGFIFGGEKIDSIILLNTKSAVRAFMGGQQVTFGGNLSVAAGPVGRDVEGHVGLSNTKEIVAAYSYSQAQGAMIAATLEGAFLSSSQSANNKFYGVNDATPENVLTGKVKNPLKAQELINELDAIITRKGKYKNLSTSTMPATTPSNTASPGPSPLAVNREVAASGRKLLNAGLSGENDLPLGWEQASAPNGQVYYYNTETGVTQWDRPEVKRVAPRPPPSIPKQRPAPAIPKRNYATALYDYVAQHPDELSFKKDDKLLILQKDDNAWWRAELRGGKGLVPSNYVQL